MVKPRAKLRSRKRHTGRNFSVLAVITAIVVIAISLSGALTPASFILIVHVYDRAKGSPQTVYDLTEAMLVVNSTVTVTGSSEPTRFTPTGIIAYDQLSAGPYQIKVNATGYTPNTLTYSVGPNCVDRTPDGQCHALVPINKS